MTADKDLVQQSYGACCLSPKFFDDFYAAFLASSSEVAGKFVNTDMTKQKQLLRDGISFMIMFYNGAASGQIACFPARSSSSTAQIFFRAW